LQRAEEAEGLRRVGVHGVIAPLFSHESRVHDRIAGKHGALAKSLHAVRAFTAAGIKVAIESPILPARLQDLDAIARLAQTIGPVAWLRVYLATPVQPK